MFDSRATQSPTGPTTPSPAAIPLGMVCAQCGYELGGQPLSDHQPLVCSECGRPVTSDDILKHTRQARAALNVPSTLARHGRTAIILSLTVPAALFILSRSWHGLVAGVLMCVVMFGLGEAAAWAQGWHLQPTPRRIFRAEWLRATLLLQGLWVLGLPVGVILSVSGRRAGPGSNAVQLVLIGSPSIALVCALIAGNRLRVRLKDAGISPSDHRYSGGVVIVHAVVAWLVGLLVASYTAAWLQMW